VFRYIFDVQSIGYDVHSQFTLKVNNMADLTKIKYAQLVPILLLTIVYSFGQSPKREVTRDTVFADMLMVDSLGITGADGAISFPLDKGRSIFMMGDSFLEPVVNRKRNVNSTMINNTFIRIDLADSTHTALYRGTLSDPDALLKPITGNPKEFYWPGHGFANQGVLHLFMSRFFHVDEGWGFAFSGTDYVRMEQESLKVLAQKDFPHSNAKDVHYGHSILTDGGYTYLYGSRMEGENSSLHIARARLNESTNSLEEYRFHDGKGWTSDPTSTSALKGVERSVPEQFSIFKYQGHYVLLMQERNLISGNIFSYISDSPVGPWYNEKLLYHTPEQDRGKDNVFTYNAMAHPQYMQDGKLLVSYCVNSLDIPKIHEVDTDYYRPVFIRVPMEIILERP
tara:strand:+ start:9437 stop:10624 length:1188 start_codon:yes stop_codon:yes gene_type:complete